MPSLHEDRERAESFGAAAEVYDRHRPTYPAELIEWIAPRPGVAVDVGCGTGRVSELLRSRGWEVVGLEPDPRMAELAQAKGLTVEVTTFEEWEPRVRDADLVCAGQAWHWVDPRVGYQKAAQILHPGGRFAAFWNLYRYEIGVQAALTEVYRAENSRLLEDSVFLGTAPGRDRRDLEPLRRSSLFESIEARLFEHRREQTVDDWLAELPTHSMHNYLDPAQMESLRGKLRRVLTAETGGVLTVSYETLVVTGVRKTGRAAPS